MPLTRRRLLAGLAATPAALALPLAPALAAPPVYAEGGLACDGTDVVAYFTEGRAVPGDPAIALDWNGARWLFASDASRAAFEADPSAHAPQYGGYCAYAASKGYIAPTDPAAWTIAEGRLFLNYSRSVRALWLLDRDGHIARADANWPGLLDTA